VAVRCAGFNPTRARPILERLSNVLGVAGSVQGAFFSRSRKAHRTVAVSNRCNWKNRLVPRRRNQGNSFGSGQLFEMVAGDDFALRPSAWVLPEGTSILLSPAGKGANLSRLLTQ
jgi:hypothetical protein